MGAVDQLLAEIGNEPTPNSQVVAVQEPQSQPQPTPAPEPQSPQQSPQLQGQVEHSVTFWDYAKSKYNLTDESIKRGWAGAQARDFHWDDEKIKSINQPTATEEEAEKTVTDFKKQLDLEHNAILNFAVEAGGGLPSMIPYMAEAAKGGLAGATAGLLISKGMGGLPITGVGASLGAAATTGQILGGQTYLDMRAKGISHDNASRVSMVSGAIQGAIEQAQVWQAAKMAGEGGKILIKPWKEMAFQFLKQSFTKGVPGIAAEAHEEALQETVNHIGEDIAAIMDNRPDLTVGGAFDVYKDTFLQSIAPFTGVDLSMRLGGFGLGTMARLAARRARRNVKKLVTVGQDVAAKTQEKLAEAEAKLQAEEQEALRDIEEATHAHLKTEAHIVKLEPEEELTAIPKKLAGKPTKVEQLQSELEDLKEDFNKTDKSEKDKRRAIRQAIREKRMEIADAKLDEAMALAVDSEDKLGVQEKKITVQNQLRHEILQGHIEVLGEEIADAEDELADIKDEQRVTADQIRSLKREVAEGNSKAEKKLQSAEKRLEALAEKAEPLADKLQELKDEEDAASGIQALLEGNPLMGNIEGVDKIVTGLRSAAVKKIINGAVREFGKIARQAVLTAKQETKLVQKVLADFIQASDLKDKEKFRKRILGFTSLADLHRNLPKLEIDIARAIEGEAHDKALSDLKDLADFKLIADSGRSKVGTAKTELGAYATDLIQYAQKFIKDELQRGNKNFKGLTDKAIAKYDEAVRNNLDTTDLELPMLMARKIQGLQDKSVFELNAIRDEIGNILVEGLSEEELRKEKEKEELKATRSEALQDLQTGGEVSTSLQEATPDQIDKINKTGGFLKAAWHIPSSGYAAFFSWEGKWGWVLQKLGNPERILKLLDVHKHINKVDAGIRKASMRYDKLLAEASPEGTLASAIKLILAGRKAHSIGLYERHADFLEGKEKVSKWAQLTLTVNEAVKLWMQLHDPQLNSRRIYGNGYTRKGEVTGTSTEEILEEFFKQPENAPYLKLATALRKFYDENFKELSDGIRDAFGVRTPRNPNYSGFGATEGAKPEEFAAAWEQHIQGLAKPSRAGATIERVENKKPLAKADAFTEVYTQIANFHHWNVWRSASKPILAILGNQEIKNVIKLKFGKGMLEALEEHWNDIMFGTHQRTQEWQKTINLWMKQYADLVLTARPVQLFAQATGVVMALTHPKVTHKTFALGFQEFFADPAKNWQRLARREFFKSRFSSIMEQHLGQMQNEISQFADLENAQLKDMLRVFVRYGDMIASVVSGHIVYRSMIVSGATEEDALLEAERHVARTQSSGRIDQVSNIGRSMIGRLLMPLTQQPTRMTESIILALTKALNHPSKENWQQYGKTLAYGTAGAFFYQGVKFLWAQAFGDDDEKEFAWQEMWMSLLSPITAPGLVGPAVKIGISHAMNKGIDTDIRILESSIPLFKMIASAARTPGNLIAFLMSGSLEDFAKMTRDYLFGPNVLIPPSVSTILPVPGRLRAIKPWLPEKLPITGLPLLEVQKMLERAAQ